MYSLIFIQDASSKFRLMSVVSVRETKKNKTKPNEKKLQTPTKTHKTTHNQKLRMLLCTLFINKQHCSDASL